MKNLIYIVLIAIFSQAKSQQISMNFPEFAGKSYDFIIFQGAEQKTVIQDTIPSDGKFTLSIPKEYQTYIGMSRWLITGTKEGGGLDMFIPGHNFSVSCLDAQPNEKNIIYVNNTGNNELNRLYRYQEGILSRYQSMLMATESYAVSDLHYSVFKSELEKQKTDYLLFQNNLRQKTDYISRLLQIVNITRGMGGVLTDQEEEKGKDISRYISQNLDWNTLYTSGHWSEVIGSWISIHMNVIKDPVVFIKELKSISSRISSPELYSDFVNRVSHNLKQYGKEDYIANIAPL